LPYLSADRPEVRAGINNLYYLMRILALTVLLVMTSALYLSVGVEAQEVLAQNTKQKIDTKIDTLAKEAEPSDKTGVNKRKVFSANDNFMALAYIANVKYPFLIATAKKQSSIGNYIAPKGSFAVNASAYTAAADECGKSDGITASGIKVHRGTLACPRQFPFGTKMEIEGMGTFTCEDRGGAIKANHVDIYVPTKSEAFAFGRRNLLATVIN
jgi:3D (Asp-Asp-Asp) domain-containing protein